MEGFEFTNVLIVLGFDGTLNLLLVYKSNSMETPENVSRTSPALTSTKVVDSGSCNSVDYLDDTVVKYPATLNMSLPTSLGQYLSFPM